MEKGLQGVMLKADCLGGNAIYPGALNGAMNSEMRWWPALDGKNNVTLAVWNV